MKWNKITIETTTAAEDMLSYELQELGFTGVEVEDHVPLSEEDRKIMYVDLLPDEIAPDDGTAKVSCYIDEKEDLEAMIEIIKNKLEEISAFLPVGTGQISLSTTEEEDWINNWKVFFKPFRLDDNIVIKPTWETLSDQKEGDIVIEIDPGTAFGSGSHETTKLCISQLKKYVKPETELLDVGTGSGILSIIALKLGAKHAVGTDLDPCAVPAVEENKEVNNIPTEDFDMMIGNIIDDKEVQDKVGYEKYDIVVANILADVLVPLTPVIVNQMKPGGIYITSGIIDEKETVVVEAVKAAGLEVTEVTYQGEWVSVTARKQG